MNKNSELVLLGRIVSWQARDNLGFSKVHYLLPTHITPQLLAHITQSRVVVKPAEHENAQELISSTLMHGGYRIWLNARAGDRQLVVNFEKPTGRMPLHVVRWFEQTLERYCGCSIVQVNYEERGKRRKVA